MSKPTVLVAEDESALVTLLRYNLEREGYRVLEARDGEEALLVAAEEQPDLVAKSFAPLRREGAGKDRVRAAPAVSCAWALEKNAHEQTGSAETLRPSLRNGLTAYAVLSW